MNNLVNDHLDNDVRFVCLKVRGNFYCCIYRLAQIVIKHGAGNILITTVAPQ